MMFFKFVKNYNKISYADKKMLKKSKKINPGLKSLSIILFTLTFLHSSFFLPQKTFSNKTYKIPPEIKDTIWVYDTIYQYDTVYIYETVYDTVFDTVYFDNITEIEDTTQIIIEDTTKELDNKIFFNFRLPELNLQPKFYIGYEFNVFGSLPFIESRKENNEFYINTLKKSFKPYPSFSMGFTFETRFNNFFYQTGAFFTDYFEKFQFYEEFQIIDSLNFYDYFQNSYKKIDTIRYINLDSLLQGDTVWQEHIDTNYIYFRDSSFVTNYDTTLNIIDEKKVNQIRYFELPIIFGYQFKTKKVTISPKAGIIVGFYNSSKGRIVKIDPELEFGSLQSICTLPLISVSSYFSVNLKFKINRKSNFYFEPYFRANLNSLYYNDYFRKKYISSGIKFGIIFLI